MKDFKQFLPLEKIVTIDYESDATPQSVRLLKPTLYKEDAHSYCCILGIDPREGIFGCGPTAGDAMESWERFTSFS